MPTVGAGTIMVNDTKKATIWGNIFLVAVFLIINPF